MNTAVSQRYIPFILCAVACLVTLFSFSSPVHAYFAPQDCGGGDFVSPYPPGQYFSATAVVGAGPAPKNNQFWCNSGSTLVPPYTYRCEETTSNVLLCKNSLNPLVDYYTCSWFGIFPTFGPSLYPGNIFDNCVHSLVPPTVTVSAVPLSIVQGSSATLTWSTTGATSCTASGGWSGSQPLSGSQTVTPPATTTYTLTCTGPGGTTPASTIVTVTLPPDTTPPTDPSGLSASAASTSQINLSWAGSTDAGGSGLAGYKIERCSGSGCMSFVQVALSATTSYSDTGLAPATTYTYRVRAYDNAGNNSVGYSNIAFATTWTPPDSTPPSAPFLSGTPFSSTQIDLSWTASIDNIGGSGLLDYRVYRGGTLIATLGNTITAYTDSGLTPSTAYSYYVVARDVAGNPANSNPLSVTTPPPPDITPPIFTFTSPAASLASGTTSALLAGTTKDGLTLNPENATCRYNLGSDIAFASMMLFSSDTTGVINHSTPISGLTNGTVYTYYVRCRDTAGNTNTVGFSHMFQVAAPVPMPPVITAVTPTSGTIFSAGTTSATLSVTTDINAYCKYNPGSDAPFSVMSGSLSGNATAHTVMLPGLTNGTSYIYFVRCQSNPGGMETPNGYAVALSVANPVNVNPVALIVATPTSGTAPFAVSADGTGSYDTDGTIAQYVWKWGDGTPDTTGTATASHTYTSAGTYTITLQVIDNQGGSGTTTQQIVVSAAVVGPPPPPLTSFCVAACTTNADCGWPIVNSVCSLSGICVAAGSIGPGPVRSNGYITLANGLMSQPTPGTFPSNTTAVVISMQTDVNAQCQYTTFVNTPYGGSAMQTFTNTGTTKHAVTLTGLGGALSAAKNYTYYVRCKDSATGDVNTSDYSISFTISGATVISPWPKPYTCLINKNFVRSNIPYLFDVCIPK